MDTLIDNLISLLSSAFTNEFKSYEYGDIEIAATSDLPLVCVKPISTGVVNSGTLRDENNFSVQVITYISGKQYLNNVSNNPSKRAALEKLIELVENRETTGEIKAKSIIGVIRRNIDISGAVLYNNEINVEYSDYLTNEEFPVCKAVVSFTAQSRTKRI